MKTNRIIIAVGLLALFAIVILTACAPVASGKPDMVKVEASAYTFDIPEQNARCTLYFDNGEYLKTECVGLNGEG